MTGCEVRSRAWCCALVTLALSVCLASPLIGQTGPFSESVELAPIACRWRADAGAVRVGERFTLVLTCSVVETSSTTVVPDQSRLDPSVIDLTPFEVAGGRASGDLRSPGYRHFQYTYDVRYFGDRFGEDVPVPSLTVQYEIESRVEPGSEAVTGRRQDYVLPPIPVRIVSLVGQGTERYSRAGPTDVCQHRITPNVVASLSHLEFGASGSVARRGRVGTSWSRYDGPRPRQSVADRSCLTRRFCPRH